MGSRPCVREKKKDGQIVQLHVLPVGEMHQRVPAVHARGVLEEHELITMPAMENLHRPVTPRINRSWTSKQESCRARLGEFQTIG